MDGWFDVCMDDYGYIYGWLVAMMDGWIDR